jgi:hypothetical protein
MDFSSSMAKPFLDIKGWGHLMLIVWPPCRRVKFVLAACANFSLAAQRPAGEKSKRRLPEYSGWQPSVIHGFAPLGDRIFIDGHAQGDRKNEGPAIYSEKETLWCKVSGQKNFLEINLTPL